MADKRPQYQATPQLQNVLDQLSPNLVQALKLSNQQLKLRCFSKFENDPDSFTFYVDSKEKKTFKVDITQKMEDGKPKVQITKISEIVFKQTTISN